MKYTYLLINGFSVIIPFLFSFHPRIRFHRHFDALFIALAITMLPFLLWDEIFTANGVWGFNDQYILGLRVLNLPLEEILFFLCIPYACLFTYHCLSLVSEFRWKPRIEFFFVVIFSVVLFFIGLYYIEKAYTSVTFISAAILMLAVKFIFKEVWLSKFFTVYFILLIPFFIVNGLLTGTGLDHPVVWYNDFENLGIRLLTIPVEDIVYGMELILLNVFLFERIKRVKEQRNFNRKYGLN